MVIYLFSKHASRFFFYLGAVGDGRRGAHTSAHPGTALGTAECSPTRAHTAGTTTDHMGRAGGERGEAGPPMSALPAAPGRPRRRRAAAAAAASPTRRRRWSGPPETSCRLARSRPLLPSRGAPSLAHAQPRSFPDSPGRNLPSAAAAAPAAATSPSSPPPPPLAPGQPPPSLGALPQLPTPSSGLREFIGRCARHSLLVAASPRVPPPAPPRGPAPSSVFPEPRVRRACRLHRPVPAQVSLLPAGRD